MTSTNGTSLRAESTDSLEKIKRQLASGSGRNLLQGPLLKRSETLRKWNERWVILDPTTGKMEYKIRRNEPASKGIILFDADSTITISPVNFHGLPKYDGCCFYIGTPQKKDYFLCAETPAAARAWVSTLHATQLVLKAHKEAVNSLGGTGSTTAGTVATVVAAANSTARESTKEIEAAMKISMRNALGGMLSSIITDGPMDDLTIMKETLRVKDEELQSLARDLRARDSAIKEIAEKLSETAEAAEAAATAAYTMDEQRKIACCEIERLSKESENQQKASVVKLKELEDKATALNREQEQLIKQREAAIQEAHLWRSELAKARDHALKLEAAVVRAEEKILAIETDTEAKLKEAFQKESVAAQEKDQLLAYVKALQAQLQRRQIGTDRTIEKTESSSEVDNVQPLTKHMDFSHENVDKVCVSDARLIQVPGDGVLELGVDQTNLRSSGDGEWNDIRATESPVADARGIATEREGSSLDIPVVSSPRSIHDLPGSTSSSNQS
uniref:PH domain-containing protein n=1 Tax=Kalanchoe fedtschenkoi TaxID=63787 RepID=A0A7N0T2Z0_KALFE